jgi:hypothetical protein
MRTLLVLCAAAAAAACAPTRIVNRPLARTDPAAPAVTVVLEPFFVDARWTYRRELVETTGVDPVTGRWGPVQVERYVAEKPVLAQAASLAEEHRQAMEEIRRLRPTWRVVSPGDLPALSGAVSLVRVVVGQAVPAGSNRFLLSALPFLWGLQVEEVLDVHGLLTRYDADAGVLLLRLAPAATSRDFTVDATGLAGRSRGFLFDLSYAEGVFADPKAHAGALISGFAERLAVAVVALVEERG